MQAIRTLTLSAPTASPSFKISIAQTPKPEPEPARLIVYVPSPLMMQEPVPF